MALPDENFNEENLGDPMGSNDPWVYMNLVRVMVMEQRPQYLQPWLALLPGRSEAEQDALMAAGREIWKYRMETIRTQLKAMRGEEGPSHVLLPTLVTDKFLAEAVYKKGGKPEMTFLVQSYEDPKAGPEEVDQILLDGITYKPIYSKLYENTIWMPSGIEEYGTDFDLFRDIRGFIGTYLHLEDAAFKTLACCYVLMSWVHDKFDALPYLRFQGDLGTGKSASLQTIGGICYRPMLTSGATTASPIFRIIDRYHGTLIVDEADFEHSDTHDEIIKIINVGYQRGFSVLRSERDTADNFDVKAYDVFGPKILATRQRFQDAALESRCLSHTMPIVQDTIRKDMDLSLGPEFRAAALRLRNKLLLWRFRRHKDIRVDRSARFPDLELRINQITQPLMACIDNTLLRQTVEARVREYSRMVRSDRRDSLEGIVVSATLWAWVQARRADRFLMKQVVERIRGEHEHLKITDRKVGDVLRRTLGVPTSARGGYSYVEMTQDLALSLAKRYGADMDPYGGVSGAPEPSSPPLVPIPPAQGV